MQKPIEVGVLGATGMVGQRFVHLLARHPWFRLVWLAASGRSQGKRYDEAAAWRLSVPMPGALANLTVEETSPGSGPRLVFSALDAEVAGDLERAFADAGHVVVSNARNHRMDADVPLLVPEVNADHLDLLSAQRAARGWSGAIVTNPNCSTVFLAMALAALRPFGLRSCMVTTLQAVSGAGYPGVASLDILCNVIPFIAGEEEKIENETPKILGRISGGRVEPHLVTVSAHTTRVPVIDGHTESVAVALDQSPAMADVRAAFERFTGPPQQLELPSAPSAPIVYAEAANRPQPRLDAGRDAGMTVTIGRLRPCPVLGYKFFALGHNTIRGAAGAAILNAELMAAQGRLE
jgi:aspartate-semialdehyde dehydrogenase